MSETKKFSKEINWDFVFDFGKHEGLSVREVVELYPSYIIWLQDETDHIVLPEIVEKAEENNFLIETKI